MIKCSEKEKFSSSFQRSTATPSTPWLNKIFVPVNFGCVICVCLPVLLFFVCLSLQEWYPSRAGMWSFLFTAVCAVTKIAPALCRRSEKCLLNGWVSLKTVFGTKGVVSGGSQKKRNKNADPPFHRALSSCRNVVTRSLEISGVNYI